MRLSKEYEELYIDCFFSNKNTLEKVKNKLLKENHLVLYSEEPSIIGRYYLQNYYNSKYFLEQRIVNVNLDGDNMDVEFHEAKLENGEIGHIEFDFLLYTKSKIYYILDKVVEPIIQTGDIGKILDNTDDSSKLIYIKNLDVILNTLSDDKTKKKIICWLEKYLKTTRFFFTFYSYSNNITSQIANYCFIIRFPKLIEINNKKLEEWLLKYVGIEKKIHDLRNVETFIGFRYYLRYLVDEGYYSIYEELMSDLSKEKIEKNKYILIRNFLIQWLQSGKNYRELLGEIMNYITDNNKVDLLLEIAIRSAGLENSKKIMYHLESILSILL